MLAGDFTQTVTQSIQEILIGCDNGPVEIEFDDGLGSGDGADLAAIFGGLEPLGGHVGREFDDLVRFAAAQDRVVSCFDPYFFAALANTLVLGLVKFSAAQLLPELAIRRSRRFRRVNKDTVVLSLYFRDFIAKNLAETVIGGEDVAVHVEFDDSQ